MNGTEWRYHMRGGSAIVELWVLITINERNGERVSYVMVSAVNERGPCLPSESKSLVSCCYQGG